MQEVTFANYRERGSIDVLAVNEGERAVLITEVKSEITSWEETQRRFDVKVRLLPSSSTIGSGGDLASPPAS